jgi:hypothetical protein
MLTRRLTDDTIPLTQSAIRGLSFHVFLPFVFLLFGDQLLPPAGGRAQGSSGKMR